MSQQQKGETMPKGEGQPSISELGVGDVAYGLARQAIHEGWTPEVLGPAIAKFAIEYRQPTASGERLSIFVKWWRENGYKLLCVDNDYEVVAQAAWNAALQSVPSSPRHVGDYEARPLAWKIANALSGAEHLTGATEATAKLIQKIMDESA